MCNTFQFLFPVCEVRCYTVLLPDGAEQCHITRGRSPVVCTHDRPRMLRHIQYARRHIQYARAPRDHAAPTLLRRNPPRAAEPLPLHRAGRAHRRRRHAKAPNNGQ
jgi:hypothetical protein